MRMRWIAMIPVLVAVAVGVFGTAVMLLWNWLMPTIFGLTTIGFWQALGLLVLSWLLLGGFRGPRHFRRHRGPRMHGRWGRMPPEERERFRAEIRRFAEEMRRHWGERERWHDEDRAS